MFLMVMVVFDVVIMLFLMMRVSKMLLFCVSMCRFVFFRRVVSIGWLMIVVFMVFVFFVMVVLLMLVVVIVVVFVFVRVIRFILVKLF